MSFNGDSQTLRFLFSPLQRGSEDKAIKMSRPDGIETAVSKTLSLSLLQSVFISLRSLNVQRNSAQDKILFLSSSAFYGAFVATESVLVGEEKTIFSVDKGGITSIHWRKNIVLDASLQILRLHRDSECG